MRTTISLLAFLVLSLTWDASASQPSTSQQSDSPLLIIWQDSGYQTDLGPKLPDGLIAAVWPDGRVIRAKNKRDIGNTYVEGHAHPKEFKKFLRFLTSPAVLSPPDAFEVSVDSASRSIIVSHAGQKHNWTRTIPDKLRLLNTIEARTWAIPLDRTTSFDSKMKNLHQFRPRS
jgi:hypothetical protein